MSHISPEFAKRMNTDRYAEAKALIFGSRTVSFSYLHRVLGVSNAQAVAYLDRMEREEFISVPAADGTRKVLARDLVGGQV